MRQFKAYTDEEFMSNNNNPNKYHDLVENWQKIFYYDREFGENWTEYLLSLANTELTKLKALPIKTESNR
jgi:hypothetical protein